MKLVKQRVRSVTGRRASEENLPSSIGRNIPGYMGVEETQEKKLGDNKTAFLAEPWCPSGGTAGQGGGQGDPISLSL